MKRGKKKGGNETEKEERGKRKEKERLTGNKNATGAKLKQKEGIMIKY